MLLALTRNACEEPLCAFSQSSSPPFNRFARFPRYHTLLLFQLLGSYLLQLRASLSYIGARRCSLFTALFQLVFWEFLHVASTLLVSGVIYYRIFFWTFTSSTSCSALQCFGLWRLLSSQRHRLASVVVLLVIVIVSSWWCFLTTTSASPVSRSTASYRSTALCGQRLLESNGPSDWLVHLSTSPF